jgi:hypothetical protein
LEDSIRTRGAEGKAAPKSESEREIADFKNANTPPGTNPEALKGRAFVV